MRAVFVLCALMMTMLLVSPFAIPAYGEDEPCVSMESVSGQEDWTHPQTVFRVDIILTNEMDTPRSFDISGGVNPPVGMRLSFNLTDNTTDVLSPQETQSFAALVDVHANTKSGSYRLLVVAETPDSNNYESVEFAMNFTVRLIVVEEIYPPILRLDPGWTGDITVVVRNYGNRGGTFGVKIDEAILPADWSWNLSGGKQAIASGSIEDFRISIETEGSYIPGDYSMRLLVIDENDNPINDTEEGFYVVLNSAPFVTITEMRYSTDGPDIRVFTGTNLIVTVFLENERHVDAENLTLKLFEREGKELGSVNFTLGRGESTSIDFLVVPKKAGNLAIVAAVTNETEWSSIPNNMPAKFQGTLELDVIISPMAVIFAGFLGLIIFMCIVVFLLVYERMRYPSDISMMSMKTKIDEDSQGPDPGENLDISSVEPTPLFSIGASGASGRPSSSTSSRPTMDEKRPKAPEAKPSAGEGASSAKRRKSGERRSIKSVQPTPPPKKTRPPRPVSSPPPAVKTSQAAASSVNTGDEKKMREMLHETEAKVHEAKLKGIDVSSLENMVRDAKKAFASREFQKTTTLLGNTDKRVKELIERRESARSSIRDAQAIIYGLRYTDIDLSQPKAFLTKAESAYKRGDFIDAIKNAEKAMDRAQEMEKIDSNGGGSFESDSYESDDDDDDDYSDSPSKGDDEVRL